MLRLKKFQNELDDKLNLEHPAHVQALAIKSSQETARWTSSSHAIPNKSSKAAAHPLPATKPALAMRLKIPFRAGKFLRKPVRAWLNFQAEDF
ncbi:MAG: hypothetical protein ACRD27_03600 [Terracidiphilus sp.]